MGRVRDVSDANTQQETRDHRKPHLDLEGFAAQVRMKRRQEALSVREAAEAAQVSFSTISRIEAGTQPDLATFVSVCGWLGVDPSEFTGRPAVRTTTWPDEVLEHLSTDPRLSEEAAGRIARVVRDMYDALARPDDRHVVAAHLRAASVLRPGVGSRLADLLTDMHSRLEESAAGYGAATRLQG